MWDGPEGREDRSGEDADQRQFNSEANEVKLQLQVNAGFWTVFCAGGRPGCGQEELPGKYFIDDNLPKEGTRIFKFPIFCCDFFHSKQILTSVPNFVFIILYSFKLSP